MQESHDWSCWFFIASEDASIPLDFVDEALDDVALSVAESVTVAWLVPINPRFVIVQTEFIPFVWACS